MNNRFTNDYEDVESTAGVNEECFVFDSSDYWVSHKEEDIQEQPSVFITIRARIQPIKLLSNDCMITVVADEQKRPSVKLYEESALSNKFKYKVSDCQHQGLSLVLVDVLDAKLDVLENHQLYKKEFVMSGGDHVVTISEESKTRQLFGYGGYYNESADLRQIGQIFYEPKDGYTKSLVELTSSDDWLERGVTPPKQGIFKNNTISFEKSLDTKHTASLYSDIKMGAVKLDASEKHYRSYDVERVHNLQNIVDIKLKQEE